MNHICLAASTIVVYLLLPMWAHAQQTRLVLDHSVEVFKPSTEGLGSGERVEAGKELVLDMDKVYWLQSRGRVPILVLPQTSDRTAGSVRVSAPDVASWPSLTTQQELDNKLSVMMEEMAKFQEALRQKNTQDAEKVLQRMESISRVDYLHFLRASLKFVKGDIEGAKDSVKRGLRRHPANEQGQSFLKALEGVKSND